MQSEFVNLKQNFTVQKFPLRLKSIDVWIENENLKEKHSQKLNSISVELKRSKAMLKRPKIKLQKLVKTLYGYRSIVRLGKTYTLWHQAVDKQKTA